ncbi:MULTISPECIES: LytR/AlgR family response regulator transcription factor [Caproicibacterium]|uniref:Stage 0 sporulation protein A homolog n=1 Tax=Caproicibacterium argilliputei TaxID=3030016 RepID=A0AA97DBP0_9FIRM|nr:LytTR family DNA-binding domain-containing protein [Caproicibacterium argilliputei]WOC32663.1 LytTR family DNA-binding domain-containing protein [Caproicibacterium argilliputei]
MNTLLKIAVCDDNAILRTHLKEDLDAYFCHAKIPVEISLFDSGEALTAVPKVYHMAFLDVEMKNVSGLTAGYWLKERNPDIFLFIVTAYERYLDDAFDLHVFRYLCKPVEKARLYRGLDAALTRNRRLTCTAAGQLRQIFVRDIVCVYSEHGKTVLVTKGESYRTPHLLSFWKENLYEPYFAQPHNSYIVNFNYISLFEKDAVTLLYGQQQELKIYISQRKYYPFKHDFFQWMESGRV